MKIRTILVGYWILLAAPLGCSPPPAVEDTGRDAGVNVDVELGEPETQRSAEEPADDTSAGVDVQVGGGQGVQVEVDPEGANTDATRP